MRAGRRDATSASRPCQLTWTLPASCRTTSRIRLRDGRSRDRNLGILGGAFDPRISATWRLRAPRRRARSRQACSSSSSQIRDTRRTMPLRACAWSSRDWHSRSLRRRSRARSHARTVDFLEGREHAICGIIIGGDELATSGNGSALSGSSSSCDSGSRCVRSTRRPCARGARSTPSVRPCLVLPAGDHSVSSSLVRQRIARGERSTIGSCERRRSDPPCGLYARAEGRLNPRQERRTPT